jgi:hypothetical protein
MWLDVYGTDATETAERTTHEVRQGTELSRTKHRGSNIAKKRRREIQPRGKEMIGEWFSSASIVPFHFH